MKFSKMVFSAVLLPGSAVAQQAGEGWYGHPHMWDHGEYGGYGMIFGPIIWLVVLGLIVVGVVWAVRMIGGSAGLNMCGQAGGTPGVGPIDLLRARYARGEIDTAEFEERKKKLEG